MKDSATNGAVVGKGQVRVCPKHGPIIVAGPQAKPITKDTLAQISSTESRSVSVTVSPVNKTGQSAADKSGTVVSTYRTSPDVPSSTYRAFASVDDSACSQEKGPPVIVCPHGTPLIYSDLEGGRHCVPKRPISEDLSSPWIRKPIAVKLGSVSAPSSPLNAVKLQRVSPQRARIFPPEVPIQKPVPVRQAMRIADPKSRTGSDAVSMRAEDPWVKGPELKPVKPTKVSEILAIETNVDGYVPKNS